MKHLVEGDLLPDFSLPDQYGAEYRLSEIHRSQNVLLVFNLGFI